MFSTSQVGESLQFQRHPQLLRPDLPGAVVTVTGGAVAREARGLGQGLPQQLLHPGLEQIQGLHAELQLLGERSREIDGK